ncbi:XdhC family protein [Desulfobacter latus]|uniref:XdhC family protein n=1 Tax=Desulfobacter latus TaxID=2292 RepID=A0A850TFM3_9BACT|nr:XdhC family protein [Desulfobacter latus]NWH06256.1 XdhC family protein [Desulfobacter latus]
MTIDLFRKISEIISQGKACVLVTVAETQGSGPMTVGKKMLVQDDGSALGTVGGGALEYEAVKVSKQIFKDRQSRLVSYLLQEGAVKEGLKTVPMVCGGTATLFYEYLSGGEFVYIFGGGHVGRALTRQLGLLGYYTILVDDRESIFSDLPEAGQCIHESFHAYAAGAPIDESSYVIICTPSHANDYNVVRALLNRGVRPCYLGLLASSAKKADFLSRIEKEYGKDVDLSHLYSPVGLDIGGASPEEIALSVAAEISAFKYGKNEIRHMRDR